MSEEYIVYIICNPITNEYYEGIKGYDLYYKPIWKYCKLLKDACTWSSKKDANDYIRYNMNVDELIVKKN